MPRVGIEPTRGCPHQILSLARLPISPPRQIKSVIISKKITDTTKEELTNALCYLTLEEENESKTRMVYKKKNDKEEHTEIIDGSLWKLDKFMEAL